jgi:hypothetical protein
MKATDKLAGLTFVRRTLATPKRNEAAGSSKNGGKVVSSVSKKRPMYQLSWQQADQGAGIGVRFWTNWLLARRGPSERSVCDHPRRQKAISGGIPGVFGAVAGVREPDGESVAQRRGEFSRGIGTGSRDLCPPVVGRAETIDEASGGGGWNVRSARAMSRIASTGVGRQMPTGWSMPRTMGCPASSSIATGIGW